MTALAPQRADPGRHGRAEDTLYDRVGAKLAALLPLLKLEAGGRLVMSSYELLCREALAFRCGGRPLRGSRLNADGTPVQLCLAIGPGRHLGLQLLSDTGASGVAADRARIRRLAELLGARSALLALERMIELMAPREERELSAEHAEAAWTGAAFSSRQAPLLKVYVNAKWGEPQGRWERFAAFAERFGAAAGWRDVRVLLEREFEPLGVALAAAGNGALRGRVYLWGYGKPFALLEAVAGACAGGAFELQLRRFGQTLLGQDYRYPTRSVVCSVGLEPGRLAGFKVELCGHCAFDSDVQANARCLQWLRAGAAGAGAYEAALAALCGDAVSSTEAKLHAYVGLGSAQGSHYSTLYFNPAAAAA